MTRLFPSSGAPAPHPNHWLYPYYAAVRCSAKEPRANGVPVPEFDVPKAFAQAGVCEVLAAGGVRRSTGRKVVTESQRQRESCASLANACCSISSSLIWSAEECGAEIVKYVPACRAHHPSALQSHWDMRFERLPCYHSGSEYGAVLGHIFPRSGRQQPGEIHGGENHTADGKPVPRWLRRFIDTGHLLPNITPQAGCARTLWRLGLHVRTRFLATARAKGDDLFHSNASSLEGRSIYVSPM